MLKRISYLILGLVILTNICFANYNDIFIADIQYDWINKSDVEKEAIISEVKDILFEQPMIKKDLLKSEFKDKLKDKNYTQNYYAASAGYEELEGNKISAFYYKNSKHIYMYALQDKNDLSKVYYYDALGNLRYIDFLYGEYPDYPYFSYQYYISGKPVSAIYFTSKDTQYLYKPDGSFKGVWFKNNLYDEHSKVILKRTNY